MARFQGRLTERTLSLSRVNFTRNDGRARDESLLYELRTGQRDATWTFVVIRRHT
jgi:hypothetical protein